MTHRNTVREEFTRQAESFAGAPTLNAPEVTERIATALGERPEDRVLDLACGPGILTGALGAVARFVVGLDLTAETLRLASARGHERAGFVRGLAESLPLRDRAFGGVVIRLALHHFEKPRHILQEARRVLRPGGRLVVLDVLTSADTETAALHNAIERIRDPSHTSFVSEAQLREDVSAAGFDHVAVETWNRPRRFDEWAAIINQPARMASLETVLRHLARAGTTAGVELRELDGEVWFTYRWALLVAAAER